MFDISKSYDWYKTNNRIVTYAVFRDAFLICTFFSKGSYTVIPSESAKTICFVVFFSNNSHVIIKNVLKYFKEKSQQKLNFSLSPLITSFLSAWKLLPYIIEKEPWCPLCFSKTWIFIITGARYILHWYLTLILLCMCHWPRCLAIKNRDQSQQHSGFWKYFCW